MIAVAGGKGGCGKTTTTLCLARAFARQGLGAIAVDADVDMPDLHAVAETRSNPDVSDAVDGRPLENVLARSMCFPGVDVLPAPSSSRDILRIRDRLSDRPEPVLLDTPAGVSRDATRPLTIADRSVIVSTPTRESLRDAAKTEALAREVGATPLGVVLTRSDGTVDPGPLLSCPTLCHVPAVAEPTRNSRARKAYATCHSAVVKRNV